MTSFPVSLVCPDCKLPLRAATACQCGRKTRLEYWEGIPRTLFGQSYWGECGAGSMATVLARLQNCHWKEALRETPGCDAVHRHLAGHRVGADFIYGLPWDRIRTVLDIGAGMGFLAAPMASFAERVTALEAVPERALFLQKRAAQDGLANLHPIIASATALPFEAHTFDLITLNGVFEYLGLWGQGDPKKIQQDFLRSVRELLRPGGILYIGIETRFGFRCWRGGRDHSGLRYTSLMPRVVADVYTRLRRSPIYGGERAAAGYRTYTYTPAQYQRMLLGAGFETVELHGCFPGYNYQGAIYGLDTHGSRRAIRGVVDPPLRRAGRWRRLITEARPLVRALEDEVLIFASTQREAGRVLWPSGGTADSSLAQINTVDKVLLVTVRSGQAVTIAKSGKNAAAQNRLRAEYATFCDLGAPPSGDGSAIVGWPRALGRRVLNGSDFFEYEYIQGMRASRLVVGAWDLDYFRRVLSTLVDGYIAMSQRVGRTASSPKAGSAVDQVLGECGGPVSTVDLGCAELNKQLRAVCERLHERRWATGFVHGDLSLNNVIIRGEDDLMLIDWERASHSALLAVDLVRLLYDIQVTSAPRGRVVSEKIRLVATEVIADRLAKLGCVTGEMADVELLFVADHVAQLRSRSSDPAAFVRRYQDGALGLLRDADTAQWGTEHNALPPQPAHAHACPA